MFTNEKKYFPMLAGDPAKNSNTQINHWDVFDTLSQRAQDLLTAEQTVNLIKQLSEQLKLQNDSIVGLSVLVRQLLFDEINQSTFIAHANKGLGIRDSQSKDFLKLLFELRISTPPINANNSVINYATADTATIAHHITEQTMKDPMLQSELLERLQSPHFANQLLSSIATNYYPKLELVHRQYVQANNIE